MWIFKIIMLLLLHTHTMGIRPGRIYFRSFFEASNQFCPADAVVFALCLRIRSQSYDRLYFRPLRHYLHRALSAQVLYSHLALPLILTIALVGLHSLIVILAVVNPGYMGPCFPAVTVSVADVVNQPKVAIFPSAHLLCQSHTTNLSA